MREEQGIDFRLHAHCLGCANSDTTVNYSYCNKIHFDSMHGGMEEFLSGRKHTFFMHGPTHVSTARINQITSQISPGNSAGTALLKGDKYPYCIRLSESVLGHCNIISEITSVGTSGNDDSEQRSLVVDSTRRKHMAMPV